MSKAFFKISSENHKLSNNCETRSEQESNQQMSHNGTAEGHKINQERERARKVICHPNSEQPRILQPIFGLIFGKWPIRSSHEHSPSKAADLEASTLNQKTEKMKLVGLKRRISRMQI